MPAWLTRKLRAAPPTHEPRELTLPKTTEHAQEPAIAGSSRLLPDLFRLCTGYVLAIFWLCSGYSALFRLFCWCHQEPCPAGTGLYPVHTGYPSAHIQGLLQAADWPVLASEPPGRVPDEQRLLQGPFGKQQRGALPGRVGENDPCAGSVRLAQSVGWSSEGVEWRPGRQPVIALAPDSPGVTAVGDQPKPDEAGSGSQRGLRSTPSRRPSIS